MTTLTAPVSAAKSLTRRRPDVMPLVYYYNANVITMNPLAPRAPHMLVCGDRILHCDDARAPFGLDYRDADFGRVRESMAGHVKFVDLRGRTVIPGICDAHAHFLWWGRVLAQIDLLGATSEQECIDRVEEGGRGVAKGEWIFGRGWAHNLWDVQNLPSKESLDAIFPDNPVFLGSKCGHLVWVNSAALAAAELNDSTPDPDGGELERRDGRLTGILKEEAIDLVKRASGEITPAQWYAGLERAQQVAHAHGITSMQTPEDMAAWNFIQKAHSEELLSMRVNFWIPVSALDHLCATRTRHGLGDDRLRISAVKVFMDGSLGGRTALMYDPYEGEPDNIGIEITDAETIIRWTLQANRAGLSMAVHAIGDLAIGNVITAYERAAEELGTDGDTRTNPVLRNRIEHLQMFSERDYDRLEKLKPIISFQPIHLCADMKPADAYWGERSKYAYACRTAADMGCLLVFGSDLPVEPCNPFYGMYAATTRNNLKGEPGNGWYPEQCISLQESLEAYTINTAIASGQQDVLGSLENGKYADFVILPEDLFEVSPEDLRDMKPLATISGGKIVYDSGDVEGLA